MEKFLGIEITKEDAKVLNKYLTREIRGSRYPPCQYFQKF